ncbi:MAG: WYL domain-containing protein [Acidimicrobiales bacterium]
MRALNSSERVARLLTIIPWVASRPGATLDEIADRFGYARDHLEADLLEVVQFVGVFPFTPDTMIEVTLDDDRVWIHYADWFARPLRLNPDQAVALMAAGTSVLELAGEQDGPLLRGLTKLGAALGMEDGLEIRLGSAPEETLDLLRNAIADRQVVALDYYVFGRDERTTREIEPHRFFADAGQWYVAAHCRSAEAERVFRIDRIVTAELVDDHFEASTDSSADLFTAQSDDPRVTIEVTEDAAWVVQQYPNEGVEELPDGGHRIRLAVTALPWLERLLVRLGPDATLVESSPAIPDGFLGSAAAKILERYR